MQGININRYTKKRGLIALIIGAFFLYLGRTNDVISLLNFLTGNNSIYDYTEEKSSSENQMIPSNLHTSASNSPTNISSQTENKKIAAIVRDSIQKAIYEELNTTIIDSSQSQNTSVEVLSYQNIANTEVYADNENTVDLSELPPQEGYGKLAIRSYCDYADYWVSISIHLRSGGMINGQIPSQYDSTKKRKSIFFVDLLPKKYKVVLNYNTHLYKIGKDTITVDVKEGEARLYTHTKVNPYGQGIGRIHFIPKGSKRIFIKVNENNSGEISPSNKEGIYFDMPEGLYQCLVVNSSSSGFAEDTVIKEIYLRAGAFERIPVNNYY